MLNLRLRMVPLLCICLFSCRGGEKSDASRREDGVTTRRSTAPAVSVADAPLDPEWGIGWASFSTNSNYDLRQRRAQCSIALQGELKTPHGAEIVAVSQTKVIEAVDGEGRRIGGGAGDPLPPEIATAFGVDESTARHAFDYGYHHYGQPTPVTVSLSGLPRLPDRIGRIIGQVQVTILKDKEIKEMAATELAGFAEVVPGLTAKLEGANRQPIEAQAAPQPRQVQVMLRCRKPGRREDARARHQPPAVWTFELLDDQGRVLESQGLSSNVGHFEGGSEITLGRYAMLGANQAIKSVRLTLLTEIEVKTVHFELHDIPLR